MLVVCICGRVGICVDDGGVVYGVGVCCVFSRCSGVCVWGLGGGGVFLILKDISSFFQTKD